MGIARHRKRRAADESASSGSNWLAGPWLHVNRWSKQPWLMNWYELWWFTQTEVIGYWDGTPPNKQPRIYEIRAWHSRKIAMLRWIKWRIPISVGATDVGQWFRFLSVAEKTSVRCCDVLHMPYKYSMYQITQITLEWISPTFTFWRVWSIGNGTIYLRVGITWLHVNLTHKQTL